MSGSLVQLVSQGVQDIHLVTDKLDNSCFTARYKKHTPFSQNAYPLEMVGSITPGSTSEVEIIKKGDLINYVWLEGSDLQDYMAGVEFELYIGGKLVDTQTFDYMSEIWSVYLATNKVKSTCINNVISSTDKSFVPLHFFFCDDGLFLPLVGMQYHQVSIKIKWGSSVPTDVKMYANYIYLDAPERNRFARSDMDILITQVQRTHFQVTGGEQKLELNTLNHPVKCLFWGQRATTHDTSQDYFTFESANMLLNGQYKFENMSPNYFHTVQGYYHTQNALVNFVSAQNCPYYTRYFMYSFANDASMRDPSGSCNFSRLDTVQLSLKDIQIPSGKQSYPLNVYAVNYNVLRIRSGMAGILFSN